VFFHVKTACLWRLLLRWPRGLRVWLCGSSLAGIAGSNPAEGMDICLLLSVVCCQVEVCAMGRSLVQRSSTECDASECDLGTSLMGKPRPTRLGISNHEKYRYYLVETHCVL